MNLFRSEYIRNISKVSIGVLIAQTLSILLSPIITRLYSPSEFGVFSLYVSIVLVIEVCACLRYEMTIVLAEDEEKASRLFWLSSLIMSLISILVAIVVLCLFVISRYQILSFSFWNEIYILMPLSVFAISAVNILTLWCTRKKYFSLLTFIQAGLVIINNILSILAGLYISGKGEYLIYSQLSSYVIIALIAGIIVANKDKGLFKNLSIRRFRELFLEYKRMALYNTPASVVNIFSQRLPAYTFPRAYGLTSVGYYDLVYRILKLPSQVVGNAIRNVFFQKASEDYKTYGTFAEPLSNNVKALVRLSILPFCLIGAFSTWLFPVIFGSEWVDSGWYVIALLPWLATSFIVVPISSAVSITSQDNKFFKLQVYCLIVRIIVIVLGAKLFANPVYTVACFSFVGCFFQMMILRLIAVSTGSGIYKLFGGDIALYIVVSVLVSSGIFLLVYYRLFVPAIIISLVAIGLYILYLKKSFIKK